MSLKEAKKYREKLMEERKYFINKNDDQFFNRYVEREITLCEHWSWREKEKEIKTLIDNISFF